MPDRSNVTYKYDGSFEGLMCCVFESYQSRELPSAIHGPDGFQTTLFPVKEIPTEVEKARRVMGSIPKKMGKNALIFLKRCFLTCLPQKELYMLKFMRLGYDNGPKVMNMLQHDDVNVLFKAEQHLGGEAHLYTGFVRFSDFGGVLVSQIEPKNYVLPILGPYFSKRFPEEQFLIYDSTHGMAFLHDKGSITFGPMEDFQMPRPDDEELKYRKLWQMFYNTIAVPGRENAKCRMSHMPKRYWKYMTEFAYHGKGCGTPTKTAKPADAPRLLTE